MADFKIKQGERITIHIVDEDVKALRSYSFSESFLKEAFETLTNKGAEVYVHTLEEKKED